MARKDRVKPTHYPFLPFHILRTAQLVSSIIVAGIMSYFLWQLNHDGYRLPWTFILLLTVSVLTVLFLSGTIVLHCCYGLNPLLNTILNSILLILWGVGFGLLTWWSSGTLAHICTRNNWDDETGVSVCRVYKALFSFSLFGVLSTLAALILDIHVQRGATRRGKFSALNRHDNKSQLDISAPMQQSGFESNPNPNARGQQRGMSGGRDGYALPEEQFAYNDEHGDIGYHGAGGQMGERGLGDRA